MAEQEEAVKAAWIVRVLGVAVPQPGSDDFRSAWAGAAVAWQDAVEAVDRQMAALGVALRATGNGWMMRIADLGLPAVTGGHKVRLMAAVRDVDRAADNRLPASVKAARQAIGAFATHLAGSPEIRACDTNPFGVSVSIASTLGGALRVLNRALDAATPKT